MSLNEKILVVQRLHLFNAIPHFSGFLPLDNFSKIQKTITDHQEFHLRATMEEQPAYKQIIPYLIFEHQKKYFLMKRKETASEQRLKNKYSLGIGGHIRQEDLLSNTIIDWAQREFHEEISYQGKIVATPLGLINDESNAVGQVHIGIVFLLQGDSDQIAIRDEHKEGRLVFLEDCQKMYDDLESWSKFVCDYLTDIKLFRNM